jgi:hypothetical protein
LAASSSTRTVLIVCDRHQIASECHDKRMVPVNSARCRISSALDVRPKKVRFRKMTDSNYLDHLAPNVLERNFDVPLPHGLGDIGDLHLDPRRLALPRCDPRPLLSSCRRLGGKRQQRSLSRPRGPSIERLPHRHQRQAWCTTPTAAACAPAVTQAPHDAYSLTRLRTPSVSLTHVTAPCGWS